MDLARVIRGFVPTSDVADPNVVFDRCLPIALEFMAYAARCGVPSTLVEVAGYDGDLSRCHPKWRGVPGGSVIHYLVRVEDEYVDWTRRQFDLIASVPVVCTDLVADGWSRSYEIDRDDAPGWIRDALSALPPGLGLSLSD